MLGQPFPEATSVGTVENLEVRNDQVEVLFFKQGASCGDVSGSVNSMIAATQDCPDSFQYGIIMIQQEDSPIPP